MGNEYDYFKLVYFYVTPINGIGWYVQVNKGQMVGQGYRVQQQRNGMFAKIKLMGTKSGVSKQTVLSHSPCNSLYSFNPKF